MKKLFSFSFQHKVIFGLLLLMNVPFFLTGYMAKSLTERMILQEKESKLMTLARVLDSRLDSGGFAAILRRNGMQDAPREKKIEILNKALAGITDAVGNSAPGLGAGYYSRDLDAIITYGPSASFGYSVGLSIPLEHPGRIVMRSNAPLIRSGTMVRGDILNAMLPIERDGEVIGYIWANELTTEITAQLNAMTRNIAMVMLLCFGVTFGLLILLSRRTVRDVDRIVAGVRALRSDLSARMEETGGELGEVASSINAMADDISKANEERDALALAEAANIAQREFLARMSHEIRTPMNGVLGMTRLAMQADPPPAQLEYLKKIQASASLLLGIINDILDFSRIEAGKLTIERHPFNPRDMVENIRELILPRARESKLDFTITLDDSVPEYVIGDELRLSQVLLNLLGNASKFTLKGSIALDLRAEPQPSGALRLVCTVTDSGIGMSEEQQKALFSPFSQADTSTSREFGGTGLGLSISKALVELMHGAISVRSEAGKGSEFSFFVDLEAGEGALPQPEEKERLWEDARYDGLAFLLVEDNDINQEIALAILADLGAVADVANNGEEGVKAFLQKDYDLILMDVRMPVMDGLEAARRIRASSKPDAAAVPIIAMTANAMREDREASRAAGMNGHIAKPIDMDELKSALFQQLKAEKVGGGE